MSSKDGLKTIWCVAFDFYFYILREASLGQKLIRDKKGEIMNKLRETLRYILTLDMSNRMIGRTLKISHNTVGRYRRLLATLKLNWSDIDIMDDKALMSVLKIERQYVNANCMPDWNAVHREMQQPHVTLQLLWEDYCLANPSYAYSYSQFTHYYRQHVKRLDITMRQSHRAGECVYVDFCGRTVPYFDVPLGEQKKAQIFVAVLGCSNYSFACAVKSQSLPDWIDANNKMLQFFNGAPEVIVPDNLKAAVTRAGREPEINRTYLEFSKHYKSVIIPARVRRPKDKSKAELTVLLVYRWILVKLRYRKFFSIDEINAAIAELLIKMNERPFKRLPGSRLSRFNEIDKPMLRPLPSSMFEYAEWTSQKKVGPDYHFPVDNHYYSVPHTLVGVHVEARVTINTVEIFSAGSRVATHIRNNVSGGHTTLPEHQPKSHRSFSEQTPDNLLKWAKSIGSASQAVVQYQFDSRPHALLGLKACATLKRLAKDYGNECFEAACKRAELIGSLSVKSVTSILKRGLTKLEEEHVPMQINLPLHDNVRGSNYYSKGDL